MPGSAPNLHFLTTVSSFARLSLMIKQAVSGFLAAVFVVLLAGCGGGGGTTGGTTGDGCVGGPANASVTYQTAWGAAGANQRSQLISIVDSAGSSVASQTLNENGASQTIQLASIPSGTYQFRIELFSRADLGGVKTGEIRSSLRLCQDATFRSAVGGTPASIVVTPDSASLIAQQSKQFFAYAQDSSGQALFTPPSSFTYDVLGNIGNVDTTGRFFALNPGQGSLRATYNPTGQTGAASISVAPFNAQRSKWTVLVYLNAANDLFEFSPRNVNQMEQVTSGDVRFVLQWKQAQSQFPSSSFDGTRRYLVKPDNTDTIRSEIIQDMGQTVDMGQWQTLRDFIAWGKTNYPADRYCLVIWNHGNGWHRGPEEMTRAVSYDDQTGNSIQIWELPQALGTNGVDILAWDASLMQMIEVAYEIRGASKFIVGSEESPPGEGYPYDRIFGQFKNTPDAPTRDLTKAFVDGMLAVPEYATRKITQSVLDTTKVQPLVNAISVLADELILVRASLSNEIIAARQSTQAYSQTTIRYYRDLFDLCLKLEAMPSAPATLKAAAANVRAKVLDAVIFEGHNSRSANSHGVSIDFSPASQFQGSGEDYRFMQFAKDSKWDDFLTLAP